jgi:hypothetical protein
MICFCFLQINSFINHNLLHQKQKLQKFQHFCALDSLFLKVPYYQNRSTLKAILRVLSNPAVLALLKNIWLLFEWQSNNEVLRDLIIPVISP